jgi:hypothetical protein
VIVVEMLDQVVHVLEITRCAAVPLADGDLFLAVVVVLRHARVVVWRRGNRAIRVFRQIALFFGRHRVDVRWWRWRANVQTWSLAWARVVVRSGFVLAAFDVFGKIIAAVLGELWRGVHVGGLMWMFQLLWARLGEVSVTTAGALDV